LKKRKRGKEMDKSPVAGTCLSIGIVLLFIGVTIAPNISANINQRSLGGYGNIRDAPGNSLVTCNYVTLWGVEQIEKELPVQDAAYLSQLMNTSDDATLASELHRYGLVPRTMTVKQVTELLSETYMQKELLKVQRYLHREKLSDTDWMDNSLCSISGYGPSSYYSTLKSSIIRFAVVNALYLFVTLPWGLFAIFLYEMFKVELIALLIMQLAYLPQMIAEELLSIGQVIIPFKLSPGILVAELFDFYGHTPPILNASGSTGNWTIQNYPGIGMHMFGFFGLWLTIQVQAQYPSATVKGHCLKMYAKGLDDYLWDGWTDWP
jgi:hypothetical protein